VRPVKVGCPLIGELAFAFCVWDFQPTFGHTIQTSQIASLCNADAQIIMLPVERVRQEVRERFRLVHGCDALLQCAPPLGYGIRRRRRGSSRYANTWRPYRRVCSYGARLYRAYRMSKLTFATSCRRSPCGRHRPGPSHKHHQGELNVGNPRPTLGMVGMGAI
jgi:hypothetical protein